MLDDAIVETLKSAAPFMIPFMINNISNRCYLKLESISHDRKNLKVKSWIRGL